MTSSVALDLRTAQDTVLLITHIYFWLQQQWVFNDMLQIYIPVVLMFGRRIPNAVADEFSQQVPLPLTD